MGMVQYHTLIVTGFKLKTTYQRAAKVFGNKLSSKVYKYPINGGESFVVFSTGSKCGWEPYTDHVDKLLTFMLYLDNHDIDYHILSHGDYPATCDSLEDY